MLIAWHNLFEVNFYNKANTIEQAWLKFGEFNKIWRKREKKLKRFCINQADPSIKNILLKETKPNFQF